LLRERGRQLREGGDNRREAPGKKESSREGGKKKNVVGMHLEGAVLRALGGYQEKWRGNSVKERLDQTALDRIALGEVCIGVKTNKNVTERKESTHKKRRGR